VTVYRKRTFFTFGAKTRCSPRCLLAVESARIDQRLRCDVSILLIDWALGTIVVTGPSTLELEFNEQFSLAPLAVRDGGM
jgi:hypothetical protein